MTPQQVIRAAVPGASDAFCEHIVWGRTPFPFEAVTARDLYRAAGRVRRVESKGLRLCDLCDRLEVPGTYTCSVCAAALRVTA